MPKQEKCTRLPFPQSRQNFTQSSFAQRCRRYWNSRKGKDLIPEPKEGGKGWELRQKYWEKRGGPPRRRRISDETFEKGLMAIQTILFLDRYEPPPDEPLH